MDKKHLLTFAQMKKNGFVFFLLFISCLNSFASEAKGFVCSANMAQSKDSDWANALFVQRGISLEEALDIAENNPEVGYFFFTKGRQMIQEVLDDAMAHEKNDPLGLVSYQRYIADDGRRLLGYCRVFMHGDVVFFRKEGLSLSAAAGLADTYTKQ